jgi:hypothetical protein
MMMNMNPLMSLMLGDDQQELMRRRNRRMAPPMKGAIVRRILGIADPNPTFTPGPAYANNQLTGGLGMNRYVDGTIQGANSLPYDVFDGLMEQRRVDGIGPFGKAMNAFGLPGAGLSPTVMANDRAMDDMMSAFGTKGSPIYGDVDAARAQFDAMQADRAASGRQAISRERNPGYNPGETPAQRASGSFPSPGQKTTPKAVGYMGGGKKSGGSKGTWGGAFSK